MENFFTQHWELASGFIGLLVGIVGYFLFYTLQRIATLEKEVKEIKMNYLNRFQRVEEHVSSEALKTQIMVAEIDKKLTEILARQEAQTNFCNYVQEQKKDNK
jgi:hypothetical protein